MKIFLRRRLHVFAFAATLFTAFSCSAQQKKVLLALSKDDHTLNIVDPVTLKVTATMPVGSDPHEVTASADGKTAYVTIYGGGSLHEINVLDLVAKKPLKTIDTRPLWGPHGIDFQAGKVWFTAEGSKAVGSYDPATGQIDWSMGTGQARTHMMYVTPDAKTIYTTNVNAGTVSILSQGAGQQRMPPPPNGGNQPKPPAGGNQPPPPGNGAPPRMGESWEQTVVPTSPGSEGFDVSPDGNWLWTASSGDGKISIIDAKAKRLAATIDAKAMGANRVKFTPDGKQVFISSLNNGTVYVYDAATHKEIKQIKAGRGAAGILMDEEGGRAFVACSADGYIVVVNLKTLEITAKFEVGGTPDGMAWAVVQ